MLSHQEAQGMAESGSHEGDTVELSGARDQRGPFVLRRCRFALK